MELATLISIHEITTVVITLSRSSDAILPTSSQPLRPARRSSGLAPRQFLETPSHREYFRLAPAPSTCVRFPKRCLHAVVYRTPKPRERNQNAPGPSLQSYPAL